MPAVRDLSVRPLGARREGLLEVVVTAPQDGGVSEAWAVRVSGVALGAASPVRAIEAVAPGRVLAAAHLGLPSPDVAARHPGVSAAAACGFTILVDTLDLPLRFEFRLRATLADGSRAKIALIRGVRRALSTDYAPRLQPLLVTSLGRMGTTLLMRMLAAHPAVVAYDRPPYEVRAAKYWLHVLRTLAAPTDATKRVGAPMEFHLERLAAGGNPFYSAQFAAWPGVEAWSGSQYVADLTAFCQQSIDGFYLATARAQGQGQGQDEASLACFAEKHFPDDYPRLMREIYPDAREIFLVRDFRDMVASMRAYNARKAFGDFGRAVAASEEEWLSDLRRGIAALGAAWRERGTPQTLVRYEDLVLRPQAALPPLLTSLGLDAAPSVVAAMIAAAAPDAPELRGHGTAASPAASIGRWERDLPPELRMLMAEQFGELLRAFGYDLDSLEARP
jgi:hypothetical protein